MEWGRNTSTKLKTTKPRHIISKIGFNRLSLWAFQLCGIDMDRVLVLSALFWKLFLNFEVYFRYQFWSGQTFRSDSVLIPYGVSRSFKSWSDCKPNSPEWPVAMEKIMVLPGKGMRWLLGTQKSTFGSRLLVWQQHITSPVLKLPLLHGEDISLLCRILSEIPGK